MFKIKMYPADNGDAFLIQANGSNLLVDGGYAATYQNFIAEDLTRLANCGGRLDLVICSHIDSDHIGGLLKFFAQNGPPGKRAVDVGRVWHNSLRSLPYSATKDSSGDQAILKAIQLRGYPEQASSGPNPISAKQGSSLAKLLREHGYTWNSGTGTSCIAEHTGALTLTPGVSIRVIGPKVERLEDLRKLWMREVRKLGHSGSAKPSDLLDDAYEMWCASAGFTAAPGAQQIARKTGQRLEDVYTPDTSVPNGSSIAFILSVSGQRGLFLGDAWAEDVISSLKALQPQAAPELFDVIKVSHHGSLHNTSMELLRVADAPWFLISTDGVRHTHPDFEVLAEIVDRPASFVRHLFFNYETPACSQLKSHTSRSGSAFKVHIVHNEWLDVEEDKK